MYSKSITHCVGYKNQQENQRKSEKIWENRRKSKKIEENQRNRLRNLPVPLPTRPGAQNRCFSKGFQIKTVDFSIPGRSRTGPALKIDAFLKAFNWNPLIFRSPAAPDPARRSKSKKIEENRRKSKKIEENRRKSQKIKEKQRKSKKIKEKQRKLKKVQEKTN